MPPEFLIKIIIGFVKNLKKGFLVITASNNFSKISNTVANYPIIRSYYTTPIIFFFEF